MLIWIDGGSDDFLVPLDRAIVDALTELGEAGYKGRHAVAGPRQLLLHFSTLDVLSPRAKAYFLRVSQEYTQLGHVMSQPKHLVASVAAYGPVRYGASWTVPIAWFSHHEYAEVADIVCENDADYEVLSVFSDAMAKQILPGCISVSRSRAGGGGSAVTVLKRLLRDPNALLLCVLDSDRKEVLGALGSTARGCRAVWVDSWRSELFVLTSRELENALPTELVVKFANDHSMNQILIERFAFVDRDIADYVCLKSGEKLCRFHGQSRDAEGYPRTRAALRRTAQVHPNFAACGDSCEECNCEVVPALGRDFLPDFAEWLSSRTNRRHISECADWPEDLREAVTRFLSFSLAFPRKQ